MIGALSTSTHRPEEIIVHPQPLIKGSEGCLESLLTRIWKCVKAFLHCISCGIFENKTKKKLPNISLQPIFRAPSREKIQTPLPAAEENHEKMIDDHIENGHFEKAETAIKKWSLFSGKKGYYSDRTDHRYYERLIEGYLQKNTLDATANAYRIVTELMPTTYPNKNFCYAQVLLACQQQNENFEVHHLSKLIKGNSIIE